MMYLLWVILFFLSGVSSAMEQRSTNNNNTPASTGYFLQFKDQIYYDWDEYTIEKFIRKAPYLRQVLRKDYNPNPDDYFNDELTDQELSALESAGRTEKNPLYLSGITEKQFALFMAGHNDLALIELVEYLKCCDYLANKSDSFLAKIHLSAKWRTLSFLHLLERDASVINLLDKGYMKMVTDEMSEAYKTSKLSIQQCLLINLLEKSYNESVRKVDLNKGSRWRAIFDTFTADQRDQLIKIHDLRLDYQPHLRPIKFDEWKKAKKLYERHTTLYPNSVALVPKENKKSSMCTLL
ncbi:MAG TPA: hypothetical protein VHO47_05095 [Candidatus Babeliales bacterium]|nr:hypothetical protein [Candidatus Babeliales bacterium]